MDEPPNIQQHGARRSPCHGGVRVCRALSLALALLVAFAATPARAQTVTAVIALDTVMVQEGRFFVEAQVPKSFRFLGTGLAAGGLTFTLDPNSCVTRQDAAVINSQSDTEIIATVSLTDTGMPLFVCIDDTAQGGAPNSAFDVFTSSSSSGIPIPVSVVILIVLLVLSGLFSGLNLGLMALDNTELKIVSEVGDENQQKYAKAIMPLRSRGNLLLCSVLLGNVLVNSTLTTILGTLAGGTAAVLGSTAGIVVFGEIVPQSVCSRHGLWVGAKTLWVMKFFMLITFPIAYPISKVLDWILGDEVGAVYQRKALLQLIRLTDQHNDLGRDEVDIITGALTYKEKTVEMVMTPIEDVFMLSVNSRLDFKTMTYLMESGHSRIPVYGESRESIVGILFVKDLAFIDPDDNTPLESVIKFYSHELREVYSDMRLDRMLDEFKKGSTHLCLVIKVVSQADRDPERCIIGIVTLEDVIEEIIQSEIIDETDIIVDNRTKTLVQRDGVSSVSSPVKMTSFALPGILPAPPEQKLLSDQMALAALTFLSTTVPALEEKIVARPVLRRLMAMPKTAKEIVLETAVATDSEFLYRFNQPTSVFTLILEGRVKVQVGKDRFTFEAGPFSTLALGVLNQAKYVSDFSAEVISDRVLIVQITRKQYNEAVAASRRGAGGLGPVATGLGPPNTASPRMARAPRGNDGAGDSQSVRSEAPAEMEPPNGGAHEVIFMEEAQAEHTPLVDMAAAAEGATGGQKTESMV